MYFHFDCGGGLDPRHLCGQWDGGRRGVRGTETTSAAVTTVGGIYSRGSGRAVRVMHLVVTVLTAAWQGGCFHHNLRLYDDFMGRVLCGLL